MKSSKAEKDLKYLRTRKGILTLIYNAQKRSSKERKMNPPEYTKKELGEWLFSQPNFEELYKNWVKSGYDTKLKPSIDRKNPLLPYIFSNIQLMTWEENYKKAQLNKKQGVNTKQLKSVVQLDLHGNLIETFISAKAAMRATSVNDGNIIKCCKNKNNFNTAGGFKWKYKKDYELQT